MTDKSIYFIVEGDVQPKQRPRFRTIELKTKDKSGKKKTATVAYTPKKTHDYETRVKSAYLAEYPVGMAFKDEPIEIILNVYFQIPQSFSKKKQEDLLLHHYPTKRPDSDNLLKSICDALNGVAYTDDSQIVMATVNKIWSESSKAEITIRAVEK